MGRDVGMWGCRASVCQEITGQWIRMVPTLWCPDQRGEEGGVRFLAAADKNISGDPRASRIVVLTITLTVLCTVTNASMTQKSYFSPEQTIRALSKCPFFAATFSVLVLHFSAESWDEVDKWHLWVVGTTCDWWRGAETRWVASQYGTKPFQHKQTNHYQDQFFSEVWMCTEFWDVMSPDVLLARGRVTGRQWEWNCK